MTISVSPLAVPSAALGESPVWDGESGSLYWVDIDSHLVLRHNLDTQQTEYRHLSGRPGSIGLTSQPGQLVVAAEHELLVLNWEKGTTAVFAQLEKPGSGNRLNDGRCDPSGGFVVGSMYENTRAQKVTGALYHVSSDGATNQSLSKIGVANGLAFDSRRRRMYFADTATRLVRSFDWNPVSGAISNDRPFFDYADHPGKPDGGCVDADGYYWSASIYAWSVIRISPDGELVQRVELPVEKPTMPCFGGPNLDRLFVTSIGGGLMVVEGLGIRGVPEPRFAL